MARKVTSSDALNLKEQPCGGTQRGLVHFAATPGSRNFIAWKVIHSVPNGNCTIRLGQGPNEEDFKVLFPLDKSANKNGQFPCGREETAMEGKEVKFPKDLTCDQCTLQLEWTIAEKGNVQQHYCADVQVIDKEVEECSGKCQNGGICMNGECKCRRGNSGAYCQYKETDGSSFLSFIFYCLAFMVIAVLILALFYGAYIYLRRIVRIAYR